MLLIRRLGGSSMMPTITPRQLLVFKRTFKFKAGQIVLAQADRLEVVKRIIRISDDGAFLQGDAPNSLAYFVSKKDLKATLFIKF